MMTKNELKNYIDAYKIKLPRRTNVAVHVYGKNFDRIRSHLNKPYDKVFNSIMEETVKTVASTIDGCSVAYTIDNDIVFMLYNNEHESPFMNNDLQKMVSIITSQVSVNFYRLFLAFNVEYEESIATGEYDENEMADLQERLINLWNALSEIPVFYGEAFTLPDSDDFALIDTLQNDNINRTIEEMSRMYMKKTEGISHKVILRVLNKKYESWFSMPEDYRYGTIFVKNVVDGKNVWTQRTYYTEKAERYDAYNV